MRHNMIPENDIVHTPVMHQEIVEFLGNLSGLEDSYIVDCTLGEGGHSEYILQNFEEVRILGIERDTEILDLAKKRLAEFGDRIEYINSNFSNITQIAAHYKKISAFLYDFGISSYHFEKSERGFSLYKDEKLDMRLDNKAKYSAEDIVNEFPEDKLADLFYRYGEERRSRRIAGAISARRRKKRIESTSELEDVVYKAVPAGRRSKNIHPATRVFQALRIYINDELLAIEEALDNSYKYLVQGGLIIAISFHSLEDRIVKNKFRRLAKGCLCKEEPVNCQCRNEPYIEILTKKPLTPKKDEIKNNRRSRSAKMRVCRKR